MRRYFRSSEKRLLAERASRCMGCDQEYTPELQESICRSCIEDIKAEPDEVLSWFGKHK